MLKPRRSVFDLRLRCYGPGLRSPTRPSLRKIRCSLSNLRCSSGHPPSLKSAKLSKPIEEKRWIDKHNFGEFALFESWISENIKLIRNVTLPNNNDQLTKEDVEFTKYTHPACWGQGVRNYLALSVCVSFCPLVLVVCLFVSSVPSVVWLLGCGAPWCAVVLCGWLRLAVGNWLAVVSGPAGAPLLKLLPLLWYFIHSCSMPHVIHYFIFASICFWLTILPS